MTSATYTAKVGLKHTGNEVGSWLADTTEEVVTGTQEITNGDFSASDVSFWSSVNAAVTIAGTGVAAINYVGVTAAMLDASLYLLAGVRYVLTIKLSSYTSGSITFLTNPTTIGSVSNTAEQSFSFTAGASSDRNVQINSSGFVGDIDYIYLRKSDNDLSTNEHDLSYYGSITKSPVKTGSEVMGYSGFSGASNYLKQSNDSLFDVGTGDFAILTWCKNSLPSSPSAQPILHRSLEGDSGGMLFRLSSAGIIRFYGSATNSYVEIISSAASSFTTGEYQLLAVSRVSGVISIYRNNVLLNSLPDSTNLTYANAVTRVGSRNDGGANFSGGDLALLRVLNTGLTQTQITEIYNSEKHLFKANSVFTQVNESYSLDLSVSSLDQSDKVESNTVMSIGGQQETVFQRNDIMHSLSINQLTRADLPRIRSFLRSVNAGETFTFDAYGSVATPDDPVSVVADPGIKEQRTGTEDDFTVPLKLREV